MRIMRKEFNSDRFVMDYFGYTKKEAIKLYLQKFSFLTRSELIIEK